MLGAPLGPRHLEQAGRTIQTGEVVERGHCHEPLDLPVGELVVDAEIGQAIAAQFELGLVVGGGDVLGAWIGRDKARVCHTPV